MVAGKTEVRRRADTRSPAFRGKVDRLRRVAKRPAANSPRESAEARAKRKELGVAVARSLSRRRKKSPELLPSIPGSLIVYMR